MLQCRIPLDRYPTSLLVYPASKIPGKLSFDFDKQASIPAWYIKLFIIS